jgi:hypothetical protein
MPIAPGGKTISKILWHYNRILADFNARMRSLEGFLVKIGGWGVKDGLGACRTCQNQDKIAGNTADPTR